MRTDPPEALEEGAVAPEGGGLADARLDEDGGEILVLGATGHVGVHVVGHLSDLLQQEPRRSGRKRVLAATRDVKSGE